MIKRVISDIQAVRKVNKRDLYESLVNDRLSQSLSSYYHDICVAHDTLLNRAGKSPTKLTRVIKQATRTKKR